MTLYQEIPKGSLLSLLQRKFSPRDFELARVEINELIQTCVTFEELFVRVSNVVRMKKLLYTSEAKLTGTSHQ